MNDTNNNIFSELTFLLIYFHVNNDAVIVNTHATKFPQLSLSINSIILYNEDINILSLLKNIISMNI